MHGEHTQHKVYFLEEPEIAEQFSPQLCNTPGLSVGALGEAAG